MAVAFLKSSNTEEIRVFLPFAYSRATEKRKSEFQKNIYFCFIDYAKAFDCVNHNKLWKILKEMGTPDLPPEKPVCRSGSNS